MTAPVAERKRLKRRPWDKAALFVAVLCPALWYLYQGFRVNLGPNPIETITHASGDWAMRFLLLTLALTPARRILGWSALNRYRRMLGLAAFFYTFLHFLTWIWLDKFFEWTEIWEDIVLRRFITAGLVSFVLLIPLAITSTTGWIRRLGGRNWQRLHRLVYLIAIAAVVHYYWLVKSDIQGPLLYGAILAVLLALRVLKRWLPA